MEGSEFFNILIADEQLKQVHQIWAPTDEAAGFVYKDIEVDEVLGEELAKLEEFIHVWLIGDEFLGAIEESKLL